MRLKITLGIALAIVLVIQIIPVTRTNPPAQGEIGVPDSVRQILARSCYDCHSYETRWPWYAYVAPVSWLVSNDVTEGREHLNFSTWQQYDAERQDDKLGEIWEEVGEGNMPPRIYLPLHGEARLSERDKAVLHEWTTAAIGAMRAGHDSIWSEIP